MFAPAVMPNVCNLDSSIEIICHFFFSNYTLAFSVSPPSLTLRYWPVCSFHNSYFTCDAQLNCIYQGS